MKNNEINLKTKNIQFKCAKIRVYSKYNFVFNLYEYTPLLELENEIEAVLKYQSHEFVFLRTRILYFMS